MLTLYDFELTPDTGIGLEFERTEGPAGHLAQAKRCGLASIVSVWVSMGNISLFWAFHRWLRHR